MAFLRNHSESMPNIAVVAQEFSTPGNCGALARVIANFGVGKLIMLNPKCDYKCKEALDRARHAKKILLNARVCKTLDYVIRNYDYIIATTAQVGTDYNITRSPLTPKELALKIHPDKKYAIVIGRENNGMTNYEIRACDFALTVPTCSEYSTMNVSHAAAVILYEIFAYRHKSVDIPPIGAKEKKKLIELIVGVAEKLSFKTEESRRTQKINWKKFIGKAMLTKREAQSLFGFFKKIKGIQDELENIRVSSKREKG